MTGCPKCGDLRTYGEKAAGLDFVDDIIRMAEGAEGGGYKFSP